MQIRGVVFVGTSTPARDEMCDFLVDDLDDAVADLRTAGADVDDIAVDAAERYEHFVVPDGQVYELFERTAHN